MTNKKVFKPKILKSEIDELPQKKFPGIIYYIDSPETLKKVLPELNESTALGFDTETRPTFKKGLLNKTALLQLSNSEKAFLFRINKIGLPDELCRILSDPGILKAGIALHDDLKSLKRIKPFMPAGFVDLQQIVADFGIEDKGLKKLTANILGFKISKRQQTSNWEREILDMAQIEYAATDAWVCHEIFNTLHSIKKINGHGY